MVYTLKIDDILIIALDSLQQASIENLEYIHKVYGRGYEIHLNFRSGSPFALPHQFEKEPECEPRLSQNEMLQGYSIVGIVIYESTYTFLVHTKSGLRWADGTTIKNMGQVRFINETFLVSKTEQLLLKAGICKLSIPPTSTDLVWQLGSCWSTVDIYLGENYRERFWPTLTHITKMFLDSISNREPKTLRRLTTTLFPLLSTTPKVTAAFLCCAAQQSILENGASKEGCHWAHHLMQALQEVVRERLSEEHNSQVMIVGLRALWEFRKGNVENANTLLQYGHVLKNAPLKTDSEVAFAFDAIVTHLR